METTERTAFQDLIPHNDCWGCGPNNLRGLRLKSYWNGDRAVAEWTPRPEHAAGPPRFLNGGIIATLLDCHSICTAIAEAYRRAGREIGEGEPIWYVTASLELKFSRPTPIDQPVLLSARVTRTDGRKSRVEASLESSGETRVSCEVLAVRVAPGWADAAPAR